MKKTGVLVLLLAIGSLRADISFMGTSGLFRVAKATPIGANRLAFGLFFSGDEPKFYADTLANIGSRLSVGFSPINFMEMSVSGGVLTRIHGEEWSSGTAESGWIDTRAGLKSGMPIWKLVSGGSYFFYDFPTERKLFYQADGIKDHKGSYGGLALLSFDFSKLNPSNPLSFHFNFGKLINKDTPDTFWMTKDLTVFGTGLLIETSILDFVLEYSLEKPTDAKLSKSPQRITPGLRFRSAKAHSIFDIGVDFALGEEIKTTGKRPIPNWRVFLGFLWISPKPAPPPPPPDTLGILAGTVKDAATNEPLRGVTIKFPELQIPSVVTNNLGAFTVTGIHEGVVTVELIKEGYKNSSAVVTIKGGTTTVKDLVMYPIPKKVLVTIVGKVMSQEHQNPIEATVILEGKDTTVQIKTNPQTGIYRTELPPGTYTVTAEAKDFISQTQPVVLREKEGAVLNFTLLKKGMHIVLRGVTFEFNKATLKPESFPVLDTIAEILIKNPKIRVEIQGHTDSIGRASYNLKLSQKRAEAVREYLIFKGVSPERLIAKGYGESRPVADNGTEEGRSLNRRVEFVILGEK